MANFEMVNVQFIPDNVTGTGINTEFSFYPAIECKYFGEYPEGRTERIFAVELARRSRLAFTVKCYDFQGKTVHHIMSTHEAFDLVSNNMYRTDEMMERVELFKSRLDTLTAIFEKHQFEMITILQK